MLSILGCKNYYNCNFIGFLILFIAQATLKIIQWLIVWGKETNILIIWILIFCWNKLQQRYHNKIQQNNKTP